MATWVSCALALALAACGNGDGRGDLGPDGTGLVGSSSPSTGGSGVTAGGVGGALATGGSGVGVASGGIGAASSSEGGSAGSAAGTEDAGSGIGGGAGAGGGSAGSGPGETPPCGSAPFDAEVIQRDGEWIASNDGSEVYTGGSMLDAMRAAVDSLSPGRTTKERIVVRDSGTMSAGASLDLPSYTILESCGTIEVTGQPSGDNAVVRGRNVTDVEVSYLTVTGAPWFGVFVRNGTNIHLGQIELRLSGGLGIRIDNHGNRSIRTRNVRIDHVYVEGTNNHGVETYGVDGLTIGTVVARNTAFSGLLLNDTINAEVGLVDAIGAGTGTGYAAFRMANRNGRINDSYDTNIHVGEVRSRGGGRGIFCVSESGGAVIDRVDIVEAGTRPAIFVEDCYNVTIAREGGSVTRGDVTHAHEIQISARPPEGTGELDGFLGYSDRITIENLTVTASPIRETPCGTLQGNNVVRNNDLIDSPLEVCPGTDQGGN